jgi:menaquinone-dependent protoporphyrinogen oxidase
VRVLVAYASRHGATRGIAERIAETLEHDGLEVVLLPAEHVEEIEPYDAVVVGGAAYNGHWMKESFELVEQHRALLAKRPVWLFSCGPTGEAPDESRRREVLRASIPREFAGLMAAISPRDEKVFYGAYDPDAAPVGLAEGLFARMLKVAPSIKGSLPSGDFRDWPEIEAWAHAIARALQPVAIA